jgi:large subunit ribosomal protein L3
MLKTIMGKKVGMTQIFDEDGTRVPVTVIEVKPNVVVQKRTPQRNQYSAIQVGYEEIASRKLNKPRLGVFTKAKLNNMKYLREIRLSAEELENYNVGDTITADIFSAGEKIDVSGITKGKGYQGVVKRYGMQGNTKTRGTHEHRRHPGSIGMCQEPGKVIKGTKLPGQMGNSKITTQNLKLIKVDVDRNLMLIKGAVPGSPGNLVVIQQAVKTKK